MIFHVFQTRWTRNRCGQAWLVILGMVYWLDDIIWLFGEYHLQWKTHLVHTHTLLNHPQFLKLGRLELGMSEKIAPYWQSRMVYEIEFTTLQTFTILPTNSSILLRTVGLKDSFPLKKWVSDLHHDLMVFNSV